MRVLVLVQNFDAIDIQHHESSRIQFIFYTFTPYLLQVFVSLQAHSIPCRPPVMKSFSHLVRNPPLSSSLLVVHNAPLFCFHSAPSFCFHTGPLSPLSLCSGADPQAVADAVLTETNTSDFDWTITLS
jgi:hypothetical protein